MDVNISTISAPLIVRALQEYVDKPGWETWLLPVLSLIATLFSAIAAWKVFEIAKQARNADVHKDFLNLMLSFDFSKKNDTEYLDYWYGRVCDFFEFLLGEVEDKRLNKTELKRFKTVMRQKEYVDFAKKANKQRKSLESYGQWIKINRL